VEGRGQVCRAFFVYGRTGEIKKAAEAAFYFSLH
jgi:hypothetical protein